METDCSVYKTIVKLHQFNYHIRLPMHICDVFNTKKRKTKFKKSFKNRKRDKNIKRKKTFHIYAFKY